MLNKNTLLTELKELIERKAYHPYLLKYLEKPSIDEDKLLLLMGLFNELEITDEERKKYILSTMLVQMALDAHENVTNTSLQDEEGGSLKNRQLTVLAGDYYSGLYYQLLSEVENIPLIRVLASAIKDINEHKILLYQKSLDEISCLIESVKAIESSLIRKVADNFNRPGWKELSANILLLNRLHNEKKSYLETGQSIIFEIVRKISFPKKERAGSLSNEQIALVLNKMDQCIAYAQDSSRQTLEKLSPQNVTLKKRIGAILEYTSITANSIVEEG
ncbi:heptaprenyl diphosphate synthase component 1 [Peribacillus cavernae]|uniref:Heptaprenyl diphosphate synthase component 1 n=1 Tax=Peribacillus cavernae TaxID=1674310 RepID=A0A3S0W7B7_9BACI|nr:heptaprenyl diphosphate synthase component 1 [Peribacillus cavernae]MDQ0218991.1 heptaprenyl diphosphate synthase [Peribacillus cavernae]RUQ29303.1 heptaprenyl diphosphate synthase component 1 [Peribacillus cavernae]